MKSARGYYDILVRTCGTFYSRIAVRDLVRGKHDTYTYSELYGVCEYISQNLQLLRCGNGVIGVLTERNPLVPAVIAAVHKNSPTFMFLDPTRDNSVVMSTVNFQAIISLHHRYQTLSIVDMKPDREICIFNFIVRFYKTNRESEVSFGKIHEHSFIVSTSGSTGEPKHIRVPIRCIQPNIGDLKKMFRITSHDVVYFSTPLTFDPSMVELLLACSNGASLLLSSPSTDLSWQSQSEYAVTVWQTTPSKLFQFSKADISSKILSADSKLRILALGGEPLNHIKQLKELKHSENKTRIFGLYGVTEMSCWACAVELQLDKMADYTDIPLGDCLSETDLEVSCNKEGPLGNILLGSASRKCRILNKLGYHQERKGKSWIDTGDVGEVKNGTVYYRGRADEVIKRFGHKVNLQLIEKTAMLCPQLASCTAVWLPNPRILTLYYTADMPNTDLGLFLKNQLDDKHMPDKIVRIESMPLNAHGKICKDNLSSQYTEECTRESFECVKSLILQELQFSLNQKLTYDEIKNKDFFSMGGSSFQAVALCNRVTAQFPQLTFSLLPSLLTPNLVIGNILKSLHEEFPTQKCKIIERGGGQRKKRNKSNNAVETIVKKKHCDNDVKKHSDNYIRKNPDNDVKKHCDNDVKKHSDNDVKKHSDNDVKKHCDNDVKKHSDNELKKHSENDVKKHCDNDVMKHFDTNFSVKITKLWSYDTGKCVDATPTIFQISPNKCVLVVGSHSGTLAVLNTKSGSVAAALMMKSRIEAPVLCYRLRGSKVPRGVVGTYDGTVACFSLRDCRIAWQININSMIKSKATIANGMLYVASYDGNLRCLDFMTGAVKHIISVSDEGISADLVTTQNNVIVVATLGGACAFISADTNSVVWRHRVGSPIFASPVLFDDDKMVAFTEVSGAVHCHSVEMGIPMWKFSSTSGNIFSSIAVRENAPSDHDFVFGCHDSNVYCLNVQDSEVKVKWKTKMDAAVYSTPRYFSNYVLASSTKGKLHVIESNTGVITSEYDLPGETFSSPITLGDQIFIGCRDDRLYALRCIAL